MDKKKVDERLRRMNSHASKRGWSGHNSRTKTVRGVKRA